MLLPVSMESWTAIKKALSQCSDDTNFCPGPYPMAVFPQRHIGCWLDRELFTLPSYIGILFIRNWLICLKLMITFKAFLFESLVKQAITLEKIRKLGQYLHINISKKTNPDHKTKILTSVQFFIVSTKSHSDS